MLTNEPTLPKVTLPVVVILISPRIVGSPDVAPIAKLPENATFPAFALTVRLDCDEL